MIVVICGIQHNKLNSLHTVFLKQCIGVNIIRIIDQLCDVRSHIPSIQLRHIHHCINSEYTPGYKPLIAIQPLLIKVQ